MLVVGRRSERGTIQGQGVLCLSQPQYQSQRSLVEKSLKGHKGSIKSGKGLARSVTQAASDLLGKLSDLLWKVRVHPPIRPSREEAREG